MSARPLPPAGPYERVIRALLADAEGQWWPDADRTLAFGCPPWLAARVASETSQPLTPRSGGNVVTVLDPVTIVGCPHLDGPGAGSLVVHDLMSGWWHKLPTHCHPELPPHRWHQLTLALAAGLNPCAALDLAGIGAF